MADNTTPFRNIKDDPSQAINRVKAEVDQLIDSLDLGGIGRKVEDFGRQNPFGLAVAALTVGLAAGMLMRKTLSSSPSTGTSKTSGPSLAPSVYS